MNLKPTKVIPCGSSNSVLDGELLWTQENEIIAQSSNFGFALAKLRIWEKDAPRIHTNLNLHEWLKSLSNLDTVETADAYWGVSRGVEILDKNLKRQNTNTPNYFKKEHSKLFAQEIERVCKEGYICDYDDLVKIWPNLPIEPQDVLGCGFVVKQREDGTLKLRLIVDCSRPSYHGVNAHVKEYGTSLPTVFSMSKHMQPNAFFAMADIADAFMNLGLKPHNWKNIVVNVDDFHGKNTNLAYTRLAFGIRSAVRIFQALAATLLLILRKECKKKGFSHLIIHDDSYIDDSYCIAKTKEGARLWLETWKEMMNKLGMPWQPSKTVEPTTIIRYLGIIANMRAMTLSIDQERVDKALKSIISAEDRIWHTLKESQSIKGHLNFIAQVVRFAKLFMRGLDHIIMNFNEIARSKGQSTSRGLRLAFNKRIFNDLKIWKVLLISFNGISVTAAAVYPKVKFPRVQSDASFWGCGFWAHGYYKRIVWEEVGIKIFDEKGDPCVSTAFVEALGLLFLLKELAPFISAQYVLIDLDNISLVHMITGEKTKSEQVLPVIVECLALIVAYDIKPRINHIGTDDMIFADPLSRFSVPGSPRQKRYKKIFANEKLKFLSKNIPWTPPPKALPCNPKALEIPDIWNKANNIPSSFTSKLTRNTNKPRRL